MTRRKRLLQLNVTANWGSTGKIAEGIGLSAMKNGWESTIAYGRMMNPSESELIKVGSQRDVYMHYALHRLMDMEGQSSKAATMRLIGQINDYAPDIIHLHNIHDHWLNYPLFFAYLAKRETPVVWTFHDCWAFTGGCAHFENVGCDKWKNTQCIGDCPKKRGLLRDRTRRNYEDKMKSISRISDRLTVVGVSDWVTNYARQSFLSGCDFHTIKNGIDLSVFTPSGAEKTPMVLGVSNVWPEYKGLSDFLKLRDILPQDIEICLVGLDKKQINSLPQGVRGIERTQNVAELVDLYGRSMVFVNPTYNDTFPTVNIEALACGTPVVTYRTGGSPEAVDAKTGIVVDKGDVEGLAKAITSVLTGSEALLAEDCRQRALTCFDKRAQFDKYVGLYESLLT